MEIFILFVMTMVTVAALGQPRRKREPNSADNSFFPWTGTDDNPPDNLRHHHYHYDGGGHHGHFDGSGHCGGGDCGCGHGGH